MQRFLTTEKTSVARSVALSLVFSTLFVAVSVGAATTISTSITTDGTLSVTGASTLTGLTTMVYGSSTSQSLTGNLLVAGRATTTGSNGNVELRGGLTIGNATTNSLAGTILFSAQTSDPTGVTEGTVYYNSTSKVLRLYDGSNWFTTGTTSSGFLLSTNRIQLDDLALRNLTLGTTTQQGTGKSLVTLEATTTASIPLSIVGYASQTAHLLDILNGTSVAGPKLLYISSSGGLFASSTGAFGGTLTVGGALTATSTLEVTGVSTFTGRADLNGQASTTRLSAFDRIYVGGTASSTIRGDNVASTLPFASSTSITTTGGSWFATDGSSNVGIGTTTPGVTFSVQGKGLVSGTLTAATFVASSTGVSTFGYASSTSQSLTGNIQVNGFASVSTTTATTTDEILVSSTGTTTISIHSSGDNRGGCLELESPSSKGTYFRLYATSTGPAQLEAGRCE